MDLTAELLAIKNEVEKHARAFGLDFYDVIYEVLDWKQMNEVAALGGFPNRYPHWRFGMEYEELSKSYSYGLSKIYEMVINNDPCYAYLLYCNKLVDQKLVMAHVCAHCDFFKHNIYFSHTNRKMMDEMANHRTRVQRYINRYGHDKVENFIDSCLSIDSLIDLHGAAIRREREAVEVVREEDEPIIRKLKSKPYMDRFINPPDFIEDQIKKIDADKEKVKVFPENPVRDVMGFLLKHAPLESWERDVLSITREEAYYFAPQGQTKIMNEGWACVTGDTLVHTSSGWMRAKEIAEKRLQLAVNDGDQLQNIYDWAVFPNKETVEITTKHGYKICGSTTHRVMMSDDSWKSLDKISMDDEIKLASSNDIWPESHVDINWVPARRYTLEDVARGSGVSLSTVIRHMNGSVDSRSAAQIDTALQTYTTPHLETKLICNRRTDIDVPKQIKEDVAAFLGYLTGDGHISRIKRVLGLTTGDKEQAERFADLGKSLFGLDHRLRKDGERYRVLFHSEHLSDLLESLGLKTGVSARIKDVPHAILTSPKSVVASFIRAYFDCDAYAGPSGIKLSTASPYLLDQIQILLLNFGILSAKVSQSKGIWHLCIFGGSAKTFMEEIGFGLQRKQKRLESYVNDRKWFKKENFNDKIVSIKRGVADVYDFSVENSHRYVAAGFINHNSFWHSRIMTEKALLPSEFIDYADHHSGTLATSPGRLNPYKIGIELFRDIEDRWNRGRFGKEYEDCQNMVEKKNWDKKLGLGRQKIFEVRKLYNDVMFIDEFLTPEFCKENKLFVYAYNISSEHYEIADRKFDSIKQMLLFQLTNMGRPIINVVDGNFGNRSELLLEHVHEGVDLKLDYAEATLKNLYRIWKRPTNIKTILNGTPKILSFDGTNFKDFRP